MSGARDSSWLAAEDQAHQLRRIFDHANDAILLIDPENDCILEANEQASRMLGYDLGELTSEVRISSVHPHEMERLHQFAQDVKTRGQGWTEEFSCMRKDGCCLPFNRGAQRPLSGTCRIEPRRPRPRRESSAMEPARDPIVDREVTAGADEEQRDEHDQIGGGELDAVVQDDEAAVLGQAPIVAVLAQNVLGAVQSLDRADGALIGEQRAGPFGDGQPAVLPVHCDHRHDHGDDQRDRDQTHAKAGHEEHRADGFSGRGQEGQAINVGKGRPSPSPDCRTRRQCCRSLLSPQLVVEIGFPIIADLSMQVAKAYGMIQPGASDTSAVRATFIIDPNGVGLLPDEQRPLDRRVRAPGQGAADF